MAIADKLSGLGSRLTASGNLKGMGAELIGYMALSRLMQEFSNVGTRRLQREAARTQGQMMTPESLYYEAALPQAQREEEMARNALFAQISGGVLGPQLARGERMIGG